MMKRVYDAVTSMIVIILACYLYMDCSSVHWIAM